ncbi:pneumococcal serine-rich repeat protein isoform X17 [Drosophila miranda]|uniref:pneumococcal serine-rich repeat protein isoform X17 n=1 Tax=Drosophila miranda TaxID=7229 RepID=UPI0007E858F4|nr:pneumococcal serine-rich repeat protein isoform X17 [Drosophila miranda]
MLLLQRRQSKKMFEAYIRKRFKANSTSFDISSSGTSAFKPTKPLDIRLSHAQQQQPLLSPITGQPLSHVPAPLLLSSSTNSGAGASFRLARSSTQPLQSPRVVHLAAQGGATASASSPLLLARQHSINDSVNLSEQLTLSVGTDSEHIFEMSGLEEDSAIQSLSDEVSASASASASATATATPASGLARSNSVRARANMFQQLQQEQSRNRRSEATAAASSSSLSSGEQSKPRAAGGNQRQPSPGNTTNPVDISQPNDDPMTPNNTQDAEFEPSSLSLAERLAFFSSLCDGSAGSASGGGRYRSRTSSYSRSPPTDRTPRNSSSSLTPTRMEYSPTPYDQDQQQQQLQQQPSSLTLEIIMEPEPEPDPETSSSSSSSQQHNGFHVLTRSATEPCTNNASTAAITPTSLRSVRMRTVGKLVLPDTFRGGDRNNNNKSGTASVNRNSYAAAEHLKIVEAVQIPVTVRAIGKIKSPFIEQQHHFTPTVTATVKPVKYDYKQTNGAGGDSGSDSGKENCASNQQQQQQQPPQVEDVALQKMVEMRKKISLLVQGQSQEKQSPAQPVNRRHTTEITSSSMGAMRAPSVDDRYAKYFGVEETFKSITTVIKTQSMPTRTVTKVEATNEHVRQPGTTSLTQKRREMLKRTRPMSLETYTSGSISPTAMPSPKRAHSPSNRAKASISSFEDIEVTPQELNAAGKDFKRLCGEILD